MKKPPTLTSIGFSLLLGAAFFSCWGVVAVGSVQVGDILLAGAFVLLLVDSLFAPKAPKLPTYVKIVALVVGALGMLQTVFPTSQSYIGSRYVLLSFLDHSEDLSAGWIRALQWLVALLCLPWIVARSTAENPAVLVRRLIFAWMAGIILSALISLSDLTGATHVSQQFLGYVNIGGRGAGLALHPNSLGISCAMAMPIAALVMSKRRLLGGLAMVVLMGGALASGSRAAQVSVVLAVMATLFLISRSRRIIPALIAIAGGIFVVIVAVAPQLLDAISRLFRFSSTDRSAISSDVGRSQLLGQAVRDIDHNPVSGIGLQYIDTAHSIFLQLLAAGGAILFVAIISYFAIGFRLAWKIRNESDSFSLYLVVSTLAWLGAGLVSNQLTDRFLYYPLAAIIALAVAKLVKVVKTPPIIRSLQTTRQL